MVIGSADFCGNFQLNASHQPTAHVAADLNPVYADQLRTCISVPVCLLVDPLEVPSACNHTTLLLNCCQCNQTFASATG